VKRSEEKGSEVREGNRTDVDVDADVDADVDCGY